MADVAEHKDPFWEKGPFVVAISLSNGCKSIMSGSPLYETEDEARREASRRCAEKPFIAFVPWPVPHMAGRKVYSIAA